MHPASEPRPRRGRGERLLVAVDRLLLATFFRHVEVEGAERVPRDQPLLLVANHVNGLIDPMLVLGSLPVVPRFLGKSTLWDIPPLRPFLRWAQVIPVYRRQDAADTARNAETFAASRRVLAAGGAIAVFPEGRSHSEPALTQLRTGAARIVLEAEAEAAAAGGPPLGVRVVPVGLVFDAKERFRSRALVEVGEPIDPLAAADETAAEPAEVASPTAVRALTERIDRELQRVTLNFATWEEARLVARAAEIYGRPTLDVPRRERLSRAAAARRAFAEGHRRLAERHRDRLDATAETVRRYDRLLAAAGLRDEQVAAAYELLPVTRFLRRALGTVLLRLPLGAVGTLLNALPFLLVRTISHRVRSRDQRATWKVFPALALYPLTWIGEAVAAGLWVARSTGTAWGWAAGLGVALAAPLTGYVALRFHDRRSRLFAEVRAFFVLRGRRRLASRLRGERAEVRRRVGELVEIHRREAAG